METQRLIASGVLSVQDYPSFDHENGTGLLQMQETEEEVVELNDVGQHFCVERPECLGSCTCPNSQEPDGSLQRARKPLSSKNDVN